jgi:hypothetical protein
MERERENTGSGAKNNIAAQTGSVTSPIIYMYVCSRTKKNSAFQIKTTA